MPLDYERRIYNYSTDVTDFLDTFVGIEGEDPEDIGLLYYGVELEVQPSQVASPGSDLPTTVACEAVYDNLEHFALIKTDSSIGNGGFEIVTTPATMLRQKLEWAKFFTGARSLTKSWPTRTCGMHVHIGVNKFTSLQLGKYLMFYNMPINKEFIYQLSGRTEGQLERWAATQPDAKLSHGLNHTQPGTGSRSSAVNLTNGKTVEIRIFRGNVQPEGFMKNLQSVQAIFRFCEEVSARNLKFTNFCEWLVDSKHASEYEQLIEWCKAIGHIGTNEDVKRKLVQTYKKGE